MVRALQPPARPADWTPTGSVERRQPLQTYLENNFWVTTAGVMSTRTLHDTLSIFGTDRVMWSCDYPYESYQETGAWFDHLEIDDQTRAKLGWRNAEQLLKL